MYKYEHLKDIPMLSTLVVLILGVWGAILNFAKRENEMREYSKFKKFSLFLIDILTSGGFAILTFYGLLGCNFSEVFSVAIAGIAAHQGTRFIYLLELYIATKYGTKEVINALKENNEFNK